MWICSQIGAREHYAIPRALRQTGRLATLYTDFWADPAVRKLAVGKFRPLATRFHPELEAKPEILKAESRKQRAKIVSWNFRALCWEMLLRKKQRLGKQKAEIGGQKTEGQNQFQLSDFNISAFKNAAGPYHGYIEVGRRFAECVREDLKLRKDLKPGLIFFAYDTGALETLEWCREQGIKCVLNQMDPNRVEVDLVRSEEKQWPGWALENIQVPEAYFARREREWALADRVVVNSEFSRKALVQQGVPAEKLAVVPLCYEREQEAGKSEVRGQKVESGKQKAENKNEFQISDFSVSAFSPLRALFLGQVILRKGIQYLIGAAKLLEKENIRFDVVGPIGISREAMATATGNVTFHGRTGRDQAADWYRRSHLFVLPTLSDGFAITQLEAMAHGLPVITTPCCGEVVSDGVDGFVVPPRDAVALARTFQRYLAQPEVLSSQSAAARVKAAQFTIERLAANLSRVEDEIKNTKQK